MRNTGFTCNEKAMKLWSQQDIASFASISNAFAIGEPIYFHSVPMRLSIMICNNLSVTLI